MPSRKIREGEFLYVRAKAVLVQPDCLQIVIDDGSRMALTTWVPARECAKLEDIGELRPPRHANPRHVER